MISKCSVKTINKVNSKAAIIFFLTHLAPQQNFYMWIPSGENEMGSIRTNKIWITIIQLYLYIIIC